MEEKRYTDDRSILRGCIERDEAAWEALVGRYSALISIAIRRRLASYNFSLPADEIRDISQGVLEKLWSGDSLDKIKNADSLPYWLAMVSGNAAMQYMRGKRRSEPPCKAFRSDTDDGPDPVDLIPSPAPGPSHDIEKDELAGEVRKAIGLLPDRERLIIELSIIRERKSGEIADMLGIPRGTVSCCARRARHKLKKYLKNLQR